MSSNTDAFDTLMNEFTGEAAPAAAPESKAPGNDTPAKPEENVSEGISDADDNTEVETSDETPSNLDSEADTEGSDAEGDPDPSDAGEDAPEGSEEKKPKGKKTAAERISEVVAKQRQAERERDAERAEKAALLARIEALEKGSAPAQEPEPSPAGAEFGLTEPTPDDVDANGEAKYPLGSFDPNFMRDLNRYDRAVERAYEAKISEQRAAEAKAHAEAQQLFDEWNAKLTEAEKASPTIRDKAQNLVSTFEGAEPAHLQTLAETIMRLDNGPVVLEYLADNLDEADKLVKLPTAKALLQLGRLDGMFIANDDEDPEPQPIKATAAPKPPATLSRGSGGNRGSATSLYDKMLKDFR